MSVVRASALVERRGPSFTLELDELTIERGESLAVLGPNGAGKTTLLKLLGLLEPRDSGSLTVLGVEVQDDPPLALRRRLSYVAQPPYLYRGRVVDEVARGLSYRGMTRAVRMRRAGEMLAQLGLTRLATRETRSLSGGETLGVALARALVLAPELLLLDEPTAYLDVAATAALEAALGLVRASSTVVFATHDRDFAERYATRVVTLAAGRRSGNDDRPARPAASAPKCPRP